jgi:hypothetical protein
MERRGGGEVEEDRLGQDPHPLGQSRRREAVLARQGVDRAAEQRGAAVDSCASFKAELGFLLDGGAALFQVGRVECRSQKRTKLHHFHAADVVAVLPVKRGHVGQACRTRDDLVDSAFDLRFDRRGDIPQQQTRAIVQHVVGQPGCDFRGNRRQGHTA